MINLKIIFLIFVDFLSENPQKLIFQRANFQFFHICEKSVKVRKIRFPAQIGMDCPVEKPLWATKSHHKQPSYAGSKTDRFAIFGPKFRIFFKFWPTTCPFVGGFVWSNFLIKAHGQPVPMVPNPGKSGNRFTRIFNRENWSILVKNQYFSVFQSWDIFNKFLSKLANFGPILIVVAYFSVDVYSECGCLLFFTNLCCLYRYSSIML